MSRDWKRLGAAIKRARDERCLTQVELAAATGLSESTIQNLESGRPFKRLPTSLPRLEEFFRWATGSAAAILAGEEPTSLPGPVVLAEPAGPQLAQGMPLRVAQELTHGEVIDTEVIDLTLPGSKSRMVVVLKRDADSPVDREALRAELEEWSRVRRALLSLGEGGTAGD